VPGPQFRSYGSIATELRTWHLLISCNGATDNDLTSSTTVPRSAMLLGCYQWHLWCC